jgi:hypothetical protein
METLKSCMLPYIGIGWTGVMPEECKHTEVHIPEKYAPWIWGWPDKLSNRMDAVDTRVILVEVMVIGQKGLIQKKIIKDYRQIILVGFGQIDSIVLHTASYLN